MEDKKISDSASSERSAFLESELVHLSADDIAPYYEEMVRANLFEFEVHSPKGKIVLKRACEVDTVAVTPAPLAIPARRKKADAMHAGESAASQSKFITSPIMGIFYRSPSPQSPAFVNQGDKVSSGAKLCIVEAMKVMNEIKSDGNYKIRKILVENGKPVTAGQNLFEVE